MKFTKNTLLYLVIVVLTVIIFLQRSCTSSDSSETVTINNKPYEVIKRVSDTVYVPKTQTVYKKGNTIYSTEIKYVNVPGNVDTIQILDIFFAQRIYKDTLHLKDSLGYISIIDTVSQNTITSREWKSNVNQKIINNTIYLKDLPKHQVYIGPTFGAIKNTGAFAGASLMLKTKSDNVYGINFGYTSALNTFVQGNILWKIKLKK